MLPKRPDDIICADCGHEQRQNKEWRCTKCGSLRMAVSSIWVWTGARKPLASPDRGRDLRGYLPLFKKGMIWTSADSLPSIRQTMVVNAITVVAQRIIEKDARVLWH